MVGESLQSALQTLKSERARIDSAIDAIEGLLVVGAAKKVLRRGRRAAKAARAGRPRGRPRRRKNAPRGLLRQKIREVLKAARKPLAPVDLRNAVMKEGYPVKNPKTLYTAVFTAAKADPMVKKTSQGFSLK